MAKKSRKKASKPEVSTIAAYVILGLLVIATSFWTGYLVGQSTGTTTQTGSVNQGKLTVIEFSDFQCPFCQRAAPTVDKLKAEYPNVEVVYKEFPLESLHPNAFNAAIAAECVRKAGGDSAFWKYHDTLFANQNSLTADNLKNWARAQGQNIDSCFDNQETASIVRADQNEGRSLGVSGTPSFYVGDELVVGAVPYETLKAKVDEKLAGGTAAAPQPVAPQPAAPAAPTDVKDGNYVMGNNDAPVTIVEFTDFQCPFCKRAHDETFPSIKSDYIDAGKVRYTIRNFPLPFHQNAHISAEAAECAGKVGGNDKYWAYTDMLFAHQDALTESDLKGYAGQIGLDQNTFDSCYDAGTFKSLIDADVNTGTQIGVSGTPTFYINGNKVVGAQPYSVFKAAIDAELN